MNDNDIENKIKKGNEFYKDFIEGTKYIYPQKHKRWLRFVNKCYQDIFEGREIKNIIRCLELLYKNCAFGYISNYIKKNFDDGCVYNRAIKAIALFGKKGPDFYEYEVKDFNIETDYFLDKIRHDNMIYELELKNNKEDLPIIKK